MGIPACNPDCRKVGNGSLALPNHTEETPVLHFDALREAISEAYHLNWTRYSATKNKDQKDKDA